MSPTTTPIQEKTSYYQRLPRLRARRYKSLDPLSLQTLFSLIQIMSSCEARLAGPIQERGVTLPGLNILSILRDHQPHGCPLNRLSQHLLVTRANITGLIDSLVRKGFVTREDHATDRRVTLAKITRRGETWLDSFLPGHFSRIQKIFSGLNGGEKRSLIQLLEKLLQSSCGHPRHVS